MRQLAARALALTLALPAAGCVGDDEAPELEADPDIDPITEGDWPRPRSCGR